MRYEDASGSISSQGSGVTDARDDADALPAGSRGPATGNIITGEGTITGAAGADIIANGPGKIVALEGAGGSDTSDGGSMRVDGRFGEITMDSRGGYSYTPHAAKPEGGSDVFRYTLADADGARDTATLTIDIGREIEKIDANAQVLVPGPDGVITLPPGVQLSDIMVVGRNLVINLPDGTQMVIIDGAVFVPQLVLNGVEVPASNLASLLIDSEPQPAAGTPTSSGGNFAVDVPPLDPGVPLGDLLPPTELVFEPPIFEDIGQFEDDEPEIFIQPNGQPATVAAADSVDERGLPSPRLNGANEPPGSGEGADGNGANNSDTRETTTGVIIIDVKDTPATITITVNGTTTTISSVGQVIAGEFGNLTITSISSTTIGYSYTLRDNTSGDATHDDFSVTVRDRDGDTATATLRINIVDDVPTARPDTDAIAAGQFGPVTGNVITDASPGDAGDGDNGADTVGADNASITSVSSANVPANSDNNPSGGFVVNGQYGVLTLQTDGSYSYVRNEGTPGGVTEVFNYTLTDGDGDTSTTTLTITIADATPSTGQNATVLLDDDALAGGNPGGVGDDVDAANTSGTLAGSGGDGPITFSVQTTGAPAGFTYVSGGAGVLLVQQGGVTVLTITVNPATGAYTVVQNAPIDHAPGDNENNSIFTINYTVTDVDGDAATGTLTINVDDDTPIITRQDISAPTLTVDETDLSINATGNFSTLFAVSYGADGPGTTTYSVTVVNGTDSGLDDVATGQDILLFNNGGVVEGRVGGADGPVAFTVSVDSATGVVTLDQIRALEHPDASNPDDPISPAANSIQLTVTAVDGDGDPVSQTINIGANLVFEDDGPTVTGALLTGTVDEDGVPGGIPGGVGDVAGENTVVSGSVATLFNSGADQPLTYSLLANTSGLPALTSAGVPVTYAVVGNTLTASAGGNTVFTFVLNADGTYTFTLVDQLDHPPGNNENDLTIQLGSIIQATDADGDSVTANANGLVITVDDDTPQNNANTVTFLVDEDALPGGNPGGPEDGPGVVAGPITSSISALFSSGADQPLTISMSTDTSGLPALTSAGVPVTYAVVGNTLTASAGGNTVFTLVLNPATGEATFTLLDQLDHPSLDGLPGDNTENNLIIDVSSIFVGTDADGDSVTLDAGSLTVDVDDDTPTVVTQVSLTGTVDEDGLAGGNAGGVNDVTGENVDVSGNVSALFSPGADQPLTYSLLTNTSGLPALTSNGVPVTYSVSGNTLTASAGGNTVFTFTLNATTGAYTFTLLDQLDHASLDGLPGDDTENPPGTDIQIALGSIIQATDADGDSVTAPANGLIITVDDDSPEEFVECPEGITINTPGSSVTGGLNLPSVGADQPGTVSFVVENGDPVLDAGGQPVTSGGDPLFYFVNADGVLEARAGGETGDVVFTVTINDDGTFTYNQFGQLGEGGGTTFNDLTSTSGGNAEFRGIGANDPATTIDVLLSAEAGGADATVNTDSDSIGAANQSVDAGETVRIDFVTDLTSGAATPSGFTYSGHVSSNSFIEVIPQVQGNQAQTVAFTVWALDTTNTPATEPDRDPTGGFSDSTITPIVEVTVTDYLTGNTTTQDVTGFTVGTFTAVAYGISVRVNADGSVTFAGIQEGDSYGINTGTGDFNAIAVQAEPTGTGGSTTDSFDLGVFAIGTETVVEPIELMIPIALTDSDGDSVYCDIELFLGPPVDAPDISVTVNEAGLPVIGSVEASNSETQSGDLQPLVTGGTGPYTFTLIGSGDGAYGTLVLNPDGTFTYTLDTPFDSQPDANDGTNPELGAESFTFEAEDVNGNTQTGTIKVNIIDDVPSIDVTAGAETGVLLQTQDADTIGGATDTASSTANFGGVFGLTFVAGADGAAATPVLSFALGVSAPGVDSGLDQGGANIYLHLIGGKVVGSTSATLGGVLPGNTVFDVSVNSSGVVTLTQYSEIDHPLQGGLNDAPFADQIISMADNLVTLTASATITDNDGDTASDSATVNIGANLQFADDGPVATNDVDTIVGGNGPATGNVITGVDIIGGDANSTDGNADSVGADAPGTITRVQSVNVPANVDTTYDGSGNLVLNGQYGTLTINANGNYSYLRTDGSAGGVSDVFTYTLTDRDGDTATATLTIGIADSFPTGGNVNVQLDDDALAGGNPGGTGDDPNSVNATGTLPGSGGDGTLTFSVQTTGAPAGFTYASGGAGIVLVQQGGTTVLTVTVNPNGTYSVVQNAPIAHPAGNNENNVAFTINYTVTDVDGDSAPGTISIDVDDDTPTVSANAAVQLDDDALAGGNPGGIGDDADATNTSGTLGHSFGADGAGSIAYLTTGAPAGFSYALQGNGDLWVMQGTTHVLTLTVNSATGAYTVAQVAPINHPAGLDENNVSFTINYRVTDSDGDSADGTISVNVDDDTPTATGNLVTGAVDEDGVVEGAADGGPGDGIPGGTGDIVLPPPETVTTGSVASLFSPGADAPLTYSLSATTAALTAQGLTSGGVALTYAVVGDTLTASAGVGNTVFTFQLLANGNFTFTLVDQLDHPLGNDENELTIQLGSIVQATDADGDTVTATTGANAGLIITVDDDTPTLGTIQPGTANNLPGAATTVGTLNFEIGADETATGAAAVNNITVDLNGATSGGRPIVTQYSNGVLTAYQDVGPAGYDSGDTTVVFTLTVNPYAGTSGQYVFDLVTPLDPTVTDTPVGGSSSFGAGPTAAQILEHTDGTDLAVVTGYLAGVGFNEATWLATGNATGLSLSSVNGSTAGWGVASNNFEGSEFFNWDFGSGALDTQGGLFTPPPGVSLPNISTATFDMINYGASDDIQYVVHFTDGTFASGMIPAVHMDGSSNDPSTHWVYTAPAGKFIADIEMFASGAGPGKVDLVSVGVQSTSLDVDLDFTVTLTDFDGDQVTGTFTINVDQTNSPSTPSAQAELVSKLSIGDSSETSSFSLMSSDSLDNHRTMSAANNNSVLLGAIAAAGLGVSSAAAAQGFAPAGGHLTLDTLAFDYGSAATRGFAIDNRDVVRDALSNDTQQIFRGEDYTGTSLHQSAIVEKLSLTDIGGGQGQAPTALLQATEMQQSDIAQSTLTSAAVGMPSAEMLAGGNDNSVDGQAKVTAEVGRVLLDALAGGRGPDLDAVIDAVANQGSGGGSAALNALASHGVVDVSAWHMAGFGSFPGSHGGATLEPMLHHDAVAAS